jgi:hypothetical protein
MKPWTDVVVVTEANADALAAAALEKAANDQKAAELLQQQRADDLDEVPMCAWGAKCSAKPEDPLVTCLEEGCQKKFHYQCGAPFNKNAVEELDGGPRTPLCCPDHWQVHEERMIALATANREQQQLQLQQETKQQQRDLDNSLKGAMAEQDIPVSTQGI